MLLTYLPMYVLVFLNGCLLASATADRGSKGDPNEMDSSDSVQQQQYQYQKQEDKLFEQLRLTRSSLKELCRQDAKQFAVAIAESSSGGNGSGNCVSTIAAGDTTATAAGGAMVRDIASFFLPDDSTDIQGPVTNNGGGPIYAIPHHTNKQQFWDMDDPDLMPTQTPKISSSLLLSTSLEAPNNNNNKRQRVPSLYDDDSGDQEDRDGQYRTGTVSHSAVTSERINTMNNSSTSIQWSTTANTNSNHPSFEHETATTPVGRPDPIEIQPTRQSVVKASLGGRLMPSQRIRPTISDEHLEDW